jgi:hypothetical protein
MMSVEMKAVNGQLVPGVSNFSKPVPFLTSPFSEQNPQFSPESTSRWLAYASDESASEQAYVARIGPHGKFAGIEPETTTRLNRSPSSRTSDDLSGITVPLDMSNAGLFRSDILFPLAIGSELIHTARYNPP